MFTYIIIYACAQEVWLCSHLVWTNWVQPIALEVIEIWDSFSNLNRWSRSLGDLNMSTLYLVLQVSFCQVSKRDLENEKCLLHWRWFFLKSQSFISFSRWARSLVLFLPSFIERRPVILKRDPWYWKETCDIEIGGWDWMTLRMHLECHSISTSNLNITGLFSISRVSFQYHGSPFNETWQKEN